MAKILGEPKTRHILQGGGRSKDHPEEQGCWNHKILNVLDTLSPRQ